MPRIYSMNLDMLHQMEVKLTQLWKRFVFIKMREVKSFMDNF